MNKIVVIGSILILLTLLLGLQGAFGQTQVVRPEVKKEVRADSRKATDEVVPSSRVPAKRNARVADKDGLAPTSEQALSFTHVYEFSRPEFQISRITIRHDDAGLGDIVFTKQGLDESISEKLVISRAVLDRIASKLAELRFLDSNENYQYEKDYAHLGETKFTLTEAGRTRTVSFNWTENLPARQLMDEYRKIGNQNIWKFEMDVARENQPLDTPRLMGVLASYVRRGELSDGPAMLPVLSDISDDERLPLIARNHAERLAKQIAKQAEKSAANEN